MAYRIKPLALLLLVASLMTACSSNGNKEAWIGTTLADIPEQNPVEGLADPNSEEVPQELPPVSLDELEQYYEDALSVAADATTRRTILIRLADILMLQSEEQLLADGSKPANFDKAINRYRELITLQREAIATGQADPEAAEQLDQMLYQISKAYALEGEVDTANEELAVLSSQYEDSAYAPEAKFRRAEAAFREGNYTEAEALYGEVVEMGAFTPFYQNAIYMYGWSQYKRGRYEDAIMSFREVMDYFYGGSGELKTIPRSQQSLAADTRRVLSLSFSNLEGPVTVSEFFADETTRPYVPLVYASLGELYLEKERYRDSAEAYRQYVLDFPLENEAPNFSQSVIDIYDNGKFPSLVVPAKEEYVRSYGVDSEYWAVKNNSQREPLKPYLKNYLEELAKYEHANAQRKWPQPTLKAAAILHFEQAADWYDEYYRTFPQDEKTPEMLFLKAEAYNQVGDKENAFEAYRFLAYDYPLPESERNRGAEAAYSTVLIANQMQSQVPDNQPWQGRYIEQSLLFAQSYNDDARVPQVLNSVAQTLLALNRQPEAIAAATQLVNHSPVPETDLLKQGWLVIGQSEYELQNYAGAQQAYGQAVSWMAADDPDRASTIERRSASIYLYAQELATLGEAEQAINEYLRIQTVAPDSDIAITAQYDAGNALMEQQDWPRSEQVFLQFRSRYPNHPLTPSLYPKLVVIYQESEQWQRAADELSAMAASSDDPEVQRQSLISAAELYEKSGQLNLAATRYEQYIQRYPNPFNERLEAIVNVSKLKQRQGRTAEFEYWQDQLIVVHDSAGSQQNGRSLYLASLAQNYRAQQSYQTYTGLRLTQPIKQSLAVKQQALQTTVASFQKVIDYGVTEFVTEATFYLGQVYANLSDSLLDSERPAGLDALALEEYEFLIEDQAYPFQEKAIELHEVNRKRASNTAYDQWVKSSFEALSSLFPGRYNKQERVEISRELY